MKPRKLLTLCLITKDNQVLLGMKKKGFGAGRWNGFGGKVEQGESIEDAAKREVQEEAGVTVDTLEEVGVISFDFEEDQGKILEVHIFKADSFSGEPAESDEMNPQWFAVDQIPYEQMWSDDQYWLPMLLAGKHFEGNFLFDRPSDATYSAKILKHELVEK
jgi:8-oxo-dGTP diphosphatase/2-hydroxy-dATP diphosphatase